MELIDIFDEQGNKIGIKEKKQAHKDKDWHKVCHVWVIDGEDVIVQRRSKKHSQPGKLDVSVGGHFQAGDTPAACCMREWTEEWGIPFNVSEQELGIPNVIKVDVAEDGFVVNEFQYIYFVFKKLDITKLKLQTEEVEEVIKININQFPKVIYSAEFMDYSKEYKNMVVSKIQQRATTWEK